VTGTRLRGSTTDTTEVFKPSPKGASMPVYTCAIRESGLSADIKAALAREMARVNSSVNHVPELGHEQAWTQARASRTNT